MLQGKFSSVSNTKKLAVLSLMYIALMIIVSTVIPVIVIQTGYVTEVELTNYTIEAESIANNESLSFTQSIHQLIESTPHRILQFFRVFQGVNTLLVFIVVAIIYRFLFFSKQIDFFKFRRTRLRMYIFAALAVFFSLPLVVASNDLIEVLGIIDLLQKFGFDPIGGSIAHNLMGYAPMMPIHESQIWWSMILVGILPAIGEELFFRGAIQRSLGIGLKNPHNAIFFTALIFSLIHFDITGFFYRFLLGALLGYIYFWGRSILLPIIAHATNNILSVYLTYQALIAPEVATKEMAENDFSANAILMFTPSLAMILLVFYLDYKRSQDEKMILD